MNIMTGADVKAIREALGRAIGRRISCRDLGCALGLAPTNAADTIRKWEAEGPTGPAAVALMFMSGATDIGAPFNPQHQIIIREIVRGLFRQLAPGASPAPSR
jgi:hypothetical protein